VTGLAGSGSPRLYSTLLKRTLPIYYLTLLVAFFVVPWLPGPGTRTESVSRDQFWYWTLLKNWASIPGHASQGSSILGHYRSDGRYFFSGRY